VSKPLYTIWLTCEARADIAAWTIVIDSFNGKSLFMSDQWLSSDHFKLFTDAAGSLGFAAVLGHMWFAESWSSPLASYDITVKERFPIVLALELWGYKMANSKVLFLSDNQAVVEIINKQTCKKSVLMRLVQRLVLAAMKCNVWFLAKHIAGKTNTVADALYSFHFQQARVHAPWLSPTPMLIPSHLFYI
jgi:hypothetical protein